MSCCWEKSSPLATTGARRPAGCSLLLLLLQGHGRALGSEGVANRSRNRCTYK
ncbi:unnamed protein product [Hapterophycus canaliculatus]